MKPAHIPVTDNPIFIRIAGRRRILPPAPLLIGLALAECVIITALAEPWYRRAWLVDKRFVQTGFAGWIVLPVLIMAAGVLAMLMVRHQSFSDEVRLLKLTDMPSSYISRAYEMGVLYRARIGLVLLAVMFPFTAQAMITLPVSRHAYFYATICPENDVRCAPGVDDETSLVAIASEAIFLMIFIGGSIWLSILAGTAFGMSRLPTPTALLLAALSPVIITVVGIAFWIRQSPASLRALTQHLLICAAVLATAWIVRKVTPQLV